MILRVLPACQQQNNRSHRFASFNTIPFRWGFASGSTFSSISGVKTFTVQFAFIELSGLPTGDKIGLFARDVDDEGEGEGGTDGINVNGGGGFVFFKSSTSFSES